MSHLTLDEQQASDEIISLTTPPASPSAMMSEEQERRVFMHDLNKFMSEAGKPLSKIPIMGYKELDLFQLFKEVTSYGGFNEVVKNVGTWSKIWKRLGNFDPSITDSSFRLKKNYERYLLDYEFRCFPEFRRGDSDKPTKKTLHFANNNAGAPSEAGSPSMSPMFSSKMKMDKKSSRKPNRKSASFNGFSTTLFPTNSISIKDVEREMDGSPKLPLVLGEMTVDCLGTIVPQFPYVTDRHVWPIGYTSSRYFYSTINPDQQVKYTCKIVEAAGKPEFMVVAEDDPENMVIAHSPSAAWRMVMQRVGDFGRDVSVSGSLRFGLTHPVVAQLIQELPNANLCMDAIMSAASEGRKKRKLGFDSSSSSDEDDEGIASPKTSRYAVDDAFFESKNVYLTTREEMDDLESAVATLQALKYSTAF